MSVTRVTILRRPNRIEAPAGRRCGRTRRPSTSRFPITRRAWTALSHLGAIEVPVNDAYFGSLLTHVANISTARVAIVDVRSMIRPVAM